MILARIDLDSGPCLALMGAVASGHHPLALPKKSLAFLSLFLPPRLPFLLVLTGEKVAFGSIHDERRINYLA